MTFKKLVKEIGKIESLTDQDRVFNLVKKAYESGKITWDDYELLYDIADFYGYGKHVDGMNKATNE